MMPQKSGSKMASIRYLLPRDLWLRVTVFSLTTGWKKRDTLIYLLEKALDDLDIPKDTPTLLMAMGYDLQGMLDQPREGEEKPPAPAKKPKKRMKKVKPQGRKGERGEKGEGE